MDNVIRNPEGVWERQFGLIKRNPRYAGFQVICVAGHGTFGVVFKIKLNDRIVALKITLQQKKFRNRELEVVETLRHLNIIAIVDQFYTMDRDNKYLNLVMDYFPSSLNQIIKHNQRNRIKFTNTQLRILSFQLFKALAYLQDAEVCHRDIKPHNILVDINTLDIKICDFGSAKLIKKGENNVAYICSRYYRAPELLFGCEDYQFEIDMWSVGCVLVEMLTFQPVFPGSSTLQQIVEIIKIMGTPPIEAQYLVDGEPLCKVSKAIHPYSWQKVLGFYKADPAFIDLVSRILVFDRRKRLKAAQALIHPYYQDLWINKELEVSPGPAHLLDFSQNKFRDYPDQAQYLHNNSTLLKAQGKYGRESTVCCTPQQQK